MNEICAILRLYVEMDIQQATFYERVGQHLEEKLSEIDETGLVNALVAFKSATTYKQLSIVTDLESIVLGNLNAL